MVATMANKTIQAREIANWELPSPMSSLEKGQRDRHICCMYICRGIRNRAVITCAYPIYVHIPILPSSINMFCPDPDLDPNRDTSRLY
jgi:hypothetical protein